MSEFAEPAPPAEPAAAPAHDPVAAAARAFKASVPEAEAEEPEPDDPALLDGEGGDEIDEPRSDDEPGEPSGTDAIAMPAGWPPDDEPLWSSLPREAQSKIAEHESERDRAVRQRFDQAAGLIVANQALIDDAQTQRRAYAEATEAVLGLVVPEPPPRSMLDKASADYDPDQYHYRKALHEETVAVLARHRAQLGQARAQEQFQRFRTINNATRDAFVASVPEAADPARATTVFRELIDYAGSLGAPAAAFESPTTALEWHVLWKAREYDRLQHARKRVADTPRPEPRKPQPPVRPGVSATRGAAETRQRGAALERLRREGTLDAGAAALKQLMKGKLS